MKQHLILSFSLTFLLGGIAHAEAPHRTHLFILSGQSNMVGIDSDLSFKPVIAKAFPGDEVIVVKVASNGQLIQKWYKPWESPTGEKIPGNGRVYKSLTEEVTKALAGKPRPDTVTFVWMQGEADAHKGYGKVYEAALRGLFAQLKKDLGREDVNWVIGRLSDYQMSNAEYPDWTTIRDIQVRVAESTPRSAWIDTDDLNGPNNVLHYGREGWPKLGERFAKKAIELINQASAGTQKKS